ncbi:MAG: FtsQ-type POTRA domain-containing protein [Gammaproteobacteria bacterium]|nr:FtsQ-type POTRA domain-containing protein [Gammaproteobacteria bacterium]NVK86513.1 FtsQ-type POTRA domain-containing protein [Gammaproteobacteria bacterium]
MTRNKRRMATVKEQPSINWSLASKRVGLLLGAVLLIASGFWAAPKLHELVKREPENTPVHDVAKKQPEANGQSKKWRVEIVGQAEFVNPAELEAFLKERIDSSFFSLDVLEASKVIESFPWVKSVQARKQWPNLLQVSLDEHQPWLNLNNEHLISKEGVMFTPDNIEQFEQLPLLKGKFGKIEDLLSMYHFFSEQMPDNDFRIVELEYSAISGWQMLLENNIALFLGNKDLSERLERFLVVIEAIDVKKQKLINYLDMRYQSGVAVGWKKKNDEQVAHQG